MAKIAVHLPDQVPQSWVDALVEGLPEHELQRWPNVAAHADEIEYAIVLIPEPGSLCGYPRLKAIFLSTAGIDHLIGDDSLPDVPICRLTHPELAARMSEYVLAHVLRQHRQLPAYAAAQRAGQWRPLKPQLAASDVTVGILGLGVLGLDAARKLGTVGFRLRSWSRSPKDEQGIDCFHGLDQLNTFFGECNYAVSFLPLTAKTRDLLDASAFAAMPEGAIFINVGRGGCVVEEDLLAALDAGHLGGAVLDVFAEEPLPDGHPFWSHPKVTVTPHISTTTHPRMLIPHVRNNIARIERGEAPLNVVDLAAGY